MRAVELPCGFDSGPDVRVNPRDGVGVGVDQREVLRVVEPLPKYKPSPRFSEWQYL